MGRLRVQELSSEHIRDLSSKNIRNLSAITFEICPEKHVAHAVSALLVLDVANVKETPYTAAAAALHCKARTLVLHCWAPHCCPLPPPPLFSHPHT